MGHSHLLQASEQCFCIYIYMRVSMVFKEGFSSHYQEKIAGHTHLLQASEQCVCIYIYMCVCLWYSRMGFRPIIKKKIAGHSHLLQASEQCFVRLQTLLLSALEYVYFQNKPSVGY